MAARHEGVSCAAARWQTFGAHVLLIEYCYDKEDYLAHVYFLEDLIEDWHRLMMAVYLRCSKKALWLRVPFVHWGCRHHRNTHDLIYFHEAERKNARFGFIRQSSEVRYMRSCLRAGWPHAYPPTPNTSDDGRDDGDMDVDSDASELSLRH